MLSGFIGIVMRRLEQRPGNLCSGAVLDATLIRAMQARLISDRLGPAEGPGILLARDDQCSDANPVPCTHRDNKHFSIREMA
jgi:hypothetical protein